MKSLYFKLFLGFALTYPLCATLSVTITPSRTSPQPVGTSISWTPTASDTNAGTIDYKYAVALNGQSLQTFQQYDVADTYVWTPSGVEGSYNVQVTARNTTTQETATVAVPFTISPLTAAAGGAPVITPTANPLVALYSAPGCPSGSSIRVKFTNGVMTQRTTASPCSPTTTFNIYVAGMLPQTTYKMNYEVVTGGSFTPGPVLSFTTGAIPTNLAFPGIHVAKAGATDTQQSIWLINAIPGPEPLNFFPFATNLGGKVLWYYSNLPPLDGYNMRPAPGGTIMMAIGDAAHINQGQQIFREIDLAGNTIRETNTTRLSQQLTDLGLYPVDALNHEVVRLPNGHTLLIASQEKLFPPGTQGSTTTVDILGNAILDLDENMEIAWYWSAYDHLNINRPAVLGETCHKGNILGCPPLHLASTANDWTHANSLNLMTDGSILLSCRQQDFLFKVDYANGTGSGNVLWTMGVGGDFTMTGTNDPYPWFTHQHDAEFVPGSSTQFTLYDNGNTRVHANPTEHSRGQSLIVDEANLTVSLALNADLGVFSFGVGSAQLLDNGNYQFDSGWINLGPKGQVVTHAVETRPDGTIIYQLNDGTITYRTYRMSSLYSVP